MNLSKELMNILNIPVTKISTCQYYNESKFGICTGSDICIHIPDEETLVSDNTETFDCSKCECSKLENELIINFEDIMNIIPLMELKVCNRTLWELLVGEGYVVTSRSTFLISLIKLLKDDNILDSIKEEIKEAVDKETWVL